MVLNVIKRQAGTLAKAAMEGVINSEDAKATRIDIMLTGSTLRIEDNGKGFQTAASIKEVFEVFGTPHELDDNGISTDAKHGTFRIGRGQLFAFGVNTWRTNSFRMHVDINKDGLEYDLVNNASHQPGCVVEVELYDKLGPSELDDAVNEIIRLCRYVEPDLYVNGEQVNVRPDTQKWDIVHDLAFIDREVSDQRWRVGYGLDVYQQGVFVETIPVSTYGLKGTIVIRKPVRLNLARNQVIRSCSHWKKVVELMTKVGLEQAKKKKSKLSHGEASSIARRLGHGQITLASVFETAFLPDTNGRMWSPLRLRQLAASTALVLNECLLVWLCKPGGETRDSAEVALSLLTNKEFYARNRSYLTAVDYKTLLADRSDTTLLPPQKWTEREKAVCQIASGAIYRLKNEPGSSGRRVCMGVSATAAAWTDGSTYIGLNRSTVAVLQLGQERGWMQLALLLAHEMCHCEPDSGTHNHTPEFYEAFHEMALDACAEAGRQMALRYRMLLERTGKRLSKDMRNEINTEAAAIAADKHYKDADAYLLERLDVPA